MPYLHATPADAMLYTDQRVLLAFHRLTDMLSFERNLIANSGLLKHMQDLANDLPSNPSNECSGPLALAMLHVQFKTPLFLTDTLFDDWQIAGRCAIECPDCGYRLPCLEKYRACVLCGAAAGRIGGFLVGRLYMAEKAEFN